MTDKNRAKKVLVIGSAVLDIAASPIGQSAQWKEKQRIRSIAMYTGGDAANQAVHLAALGLEPTLVTAVGADGNGVFLRSALKARGVVTDQIAVREDAATGTALVLVDEDGQRHTFSVQGAHSTLCEEDLAWLTDDVLSGFAAITLASPFSMPCLESKGLEELLKRAKKLQIPVFSDLASDKLGQGIEGIRRFLPYFDYFLPSLYDAKAMTAPLWQSQSAQCDVADPASASAAVYHSFGAKHVCIKCGENGCFISSPDYTGCVPAIPVTVTDTTGAGDCMSAAFLARILAGDDMKSACVYACAAGSWNTQYPGASAQNLSDQAVRALL